MPLLLLPPSSDSAALCSTFRSISTHGAASAGAGASSRRTVGRCGDGEIHLHGTCLSPFLIYMHSSYYIRSVQLVEFRKLKLLARRRTCFSSFCFHERTRCLSPRVVEFSVRLCLMRPDRNGDPKPLNLLCFLFECLNSMIARRVQVLSSDGASLSAMHNQRTLA